MKKTVFLPLFFILIGSLPLWAQETEEAPTTQSVEFGTIRPKLIPSQGMAAALAAKHAAEGLGNAAGSAVQGVGNAIGGVGSAIGGLFESAATKRQRQEEEQREQEEERRKQEEATLSLDLKNLEGEPILNYLNNTTFHIVADMEGNKVKGLKLHNYDSTIGKQRLVYGVIPSQPPTILNEQGDIEFKISIPMPQESQKEGSEENTPENKKEVLMIVTIHAPESVTENGQSLYKYKTNLTLTGFPSALGPDDSIVLRNHEYPLTLQYNPTQQQGKILKEMVVGKEACCDEAGTILPETPGEAPQKCVKCKESQPVSTEVKEVQLYFDVNMDKSFGSKKIRFVGPDGAYEDDQVYYRRPEIKGGFCSPPSLTEPFSSSYSFIDSVYNVTLPLI